jgi:single-stranded DNA-binding protein
MNVISVRGNLVRDAEVKKTDGGLYLIKGTIADNYGMKDDQVNWIRFTRFMKKEPSEKWLARLCKGAFIIIDGRLEITKREAKGTMYTNVDVIAQTIESPVAASKTVQEAVAPAGDSAESKKGKDGEKEEIPF